MALIVILKVSFLRSYYDDQGHIVPEQSTADQVAYDQTPPGNDRMEREHQDNIQSTGFLDLPAELQNQIYNYALVSSEIVQISYHWPYISEPALLRAHPIIRAAATSVFYGCNIFNVGTELQLYHFIRAYDNRRLRMIREIRLHDPNFRFCLAQTERTLQRIIGKCESLNKGLRRDVVRLPLKVVPTYYPYRYPYRRTWVPLAGFDDYKQVSTKDGSNIVCREEDVHCHGTPIVRKKDTTFSASTAAQSAHTTQ